MNKSIPFLFVLFLALPFGAAPVEIATVLALIGGLVFGARRSWPLAGPVALFAVVMLVASARDGTTGAIAALGRGWSLALLLAMPLLTARLSSRTSTRVGNLGLGAAAVAGTWALIESTVAGTWPWASIATGPWSHHLTLGYALLPPFAYAIHRRAWPAGALIGLGVVSSGATGPFVALLAVIATLFVRPVVALVGGCVAVVVGIFVLSSHPGLADRAVLWATGVQLATTHPSGVGTAGYRDAAEVVQAQIAPDFLFPLHAHDAALQIAAEAGVAAWIVASWLLVALWRLASPPGRAGIVAILVGGLTQDTWGDLEVARAVSAWALLPWPERPGSDT